MGYLMTQHNLKPQLQKFGARGEMMAAMLGGVPGYSEEYQIKMVCRMQTYIIFLRRSLL
jgi:hypothetical protein